MSYLECFSSEEYAPYLTEMGLETALNPVLKCAVNDNVIYEKLTPLFQGRCVPDAILCYSDCWALPVCRVLKKNEAPHSAGYFRYGVLRFS